MTCNVSIKIAKANQLVVERGTTVLRKCDFCQPNGRVQQVALLYIVYRCFTVGGVC